MWAMAKELHLPRSYLLRLFVSCVQPFLQLLGLGAVADASERLGLL